MRDATIVQFSFGHFLHWDTNYIEFLDFTTLLEQRIYE